MSVPTSAIAPEIVDAWAFGWTIARRVPPPVRIPGGLRIDTGTPRERARYIFYRFQNDMISRIAAADPAPGVVIKICCSIQDISSSLPPGWALHAPRSMMTIAPGHHPAPHAAALPETYEITLAATGPIVSATIRRAEEICAAGQMARHDRYAIIDDIHTAPAHRRLGLGAAVMARLMHAGSAAPKSRSSSPPRMDKPSTPPSAGASYPLTHPSSVFSVSAKTIRPCPRA